ncbi:MAG: beta-galactosidase [Clostridia bacterium]|nr:beta-galactosidase [Clostridia bacterium]
MNSIPRPEYPRPEFVRGEWINLNGEWQFEKDTGISGRARGLHKAESLCEKITVPFCMESELSGVGYKDFCECVWYKREIDIPAAWLEKNKRVILHIGACDYKTELFINGEYVGVHFGGSVAFSFDITKHISAGKNIVTISAQDYTRSQNQPLGKQSERYESYGCFYTRTTGIWQTVWLENLPESYIVGAKYYPNIEDSTLTAVVTAKLGEGKKVKAEAFFGGKLVGADTATVCGGTAMLKIKLNELHLWDIGKGELYDLKLTMGEDSVDSYFGMRNVSVSDDGAIVLNGRKIFQRLVLDQGFYPDGIWTASCEDELINDIKRSIAMGFDGARLHQKVFEPRFLYHCDKLGYIVWGEHGNWGLDISRANAYKAFFPEWSEIVERDFNHPAIIGWCSLNETKANQDNEFVRQVYELTKRLDPTRPAIDTSGWLHVKGVGDMMDWHDYDQNPETFKARYEAVARGEDVLVYAHRPRVFPIFATFVSEYGGIKWDVNSNLGNAWGYGDAPKTEEEFKERFKGLTEALLFNKFMTGLCYTQLTDVEQETNGLYTYDRQPKFDPEFFRSVLQQKAACEE